MRDEGIHNALMRTTMRGAVRAEAALKFGSFFVKLSGALYVRVKHWICSDN